ncbi:hypothetical protein WS72_17540 [Burkholderia savannae]|uniref:Uncharacterized protein n=1 Tax=Burkholderia savannae TaxID=1637837 RepID=A0ABR5THK1_9BURK|nr:hypothetical protein WS91_03560 [Burkholderia sp. MSMB1498]KWZ44473.1 hypothetical protein WS72_17540 [Burkholderia savannae]
MRADRRAAPAAQGTAIQVASFARDIRKAIGGLKGDFSRIRTGVVESPRLLARESAPTHGRLAPDGAPPRFGRSVIRLHSAAQ